MKPPIVFSPRRLHREEHEESEREQWMDDTSNLFSRLDIDKNSASPHLEDMDDMDIDLVEEARTPSFNPGVGSRRKKNSNQRRDYGHRTFGSRSTARDDTEQQHRRARLVQLINNALETEDSSQAKDKTLVSEHNKPHNGSSFEKNLNPPEFSLRHPRNKGTWKNKGKKQLPFCDRGDEVLKSREKKEKMEGNSFRSDSFRSDASWRNQEQRRMVQNGFYSHRNSAENRALTEADAQGMRDLVAEETCSSIMKNSNKDRMTGFVSYPASRPRTGQGYQRRSQFVSHPKNLGPRRLLQNSCISHYNGEWNKYAAKDNGAGTIMPGECSDGNSVHHIGIPGSESRHIGKDKGKMIMENSILSGGQDTKDELHSERMEVSIEASATADDNANRSIADMGWRSKAPVFPSEESVCVSKRDEATSDHLSDPRHKITMEYGDHVNLERTTYPSLNPSGILAPESETRSRRCRRRQKFMKGKKDCHSICSNYTGSSSSTFENTEMLHLQSSRHIPRAVDSQQYSDNFDSVIERDKLQSPLGRCINIQEQSSSVTDHSSARISQVESDEMIARQLQEQFYDEAAGYANREIDATIAWSLQQEDTRLAASTARSVWPDNYLSVTCCEKRGSFNCFMPTKSFKFEVFSPSKPFKREASMAHLYEYYARLPYQNSSARWSNHHEFQTSNTRRNYYGSEIDLETRMMAEVRNFTGMDSGTRRNFLEELEAAFDQSNDALAEFALESHNDFNEYDYETLLALDENNHQCAGASEGQINSLPQSVIQSDSVGEACAICLENPSFGDIIRHLPCLHKFHQECIDPWLRRRTSCPVCKSDILLNG